MSEKYVTPPVISFEAIFEQSNPFSPIIFILSPGSDPASDLMKLAERSGFGGNKLKFLAMGQGQEKVSVLVSLSNQDVFERSTSTGSGFFCILGQWVCPDYQVKSLYALSNTNLEASSVVYWSKGERAHFRVTCVVQKHLCLISLLQSLWCFLSNDSWLAGNSILTTLL